MPIQEEQNAQTNEPKRVDAFIFTNYKAALDAVIGAEERAKAYLDATYKGTTKPTFYLSELAPLRVSLERTLQKLQKENEIWLKKESMQIEALALKEVSESEALALLENAYQEYSENANALSRAESRIGVIEKTFAASNTRSKDNAPAKPPKNAAALEKEKQALVSEKETRIGIIAKIKEKVLGWKEQIVAFVERLKERGFLEKALALRATLAKAWDFAQKVFGDGKAILNEIKEALDDVAKDNAPELSTGMGDPTTENNLKP